ncbi:hypothetical protein BaRGS_00029161, partial [Batillaria attramentaria]
MKKQFLFLAILALSKSSVTERVPRSDDPQPLEAVVEQLSEAMNSLQTLVISQGRMIKDLEADKGDQYSTHVSGSSILSLRVGDVVSHAQEAGLVLSHVTLGDAGNYSVEVVGEGPRGLSEILRRMVFVDVATGSKRKAAESTDTSQDLSSSCEIPRERKTELLKKARSKAKKNRRDPGAGMSIKAHFSVAKDTTAASSATGTDSASDTVGGSERRDTETVSNADLQKKLCEMSEQLAKVNVSVEELRGEIFEVKQENSVLRKDLEKCQKNLQRAEEVAAEAKTLAAIAERRVNDLEQYGRRNNVRILGVPESKGEDCEKLVLDIFRKNLRLRDMGNMDIEAAHRVGQHPQSQRGPQQKSPKARPIIVRFVNRKAADTVLYNR